MNTPEATISYPSLFKARLPKRPKATDKPKFSCTLLFTAEAMASAEFKAIFDDVIACARAEFGSAADTMIAEGALRLPFRKDVLTKGHPPEYKCFVNLNSNEDHPPAVVGRDAKPITDQREIYPGAKVRASVRAYPYGGKGTDMTPGVALGLGNVQKLGEGVRIDGTKSAADEFGALEPLPAAPLADGPSPGAAASAAGTNAALAALMG